VVSLTVTIMCSPLESHDVARGWLR
jgi:hypothetical protein